jgi:UDP-glucose 4-epimerase
LLSLEFIFTSKKGRNNLKFLITGGAGFIGSHMARYLLKENASNEVSIYDNLTSGTLSHIEDLFSISRFNFIEADIKDLATLTNSMKKIDTVIHFAANPDIAKAVKQPDIDFWEGTYLTQNVLEAMRVNSVPSILYTSGSGVYGDVPEFAFNESYGPCFPISTYGASKLACEALISSYCFMFGIKGRAFRFANVVGPKQTHGVGYDFIRRLKLNPSFLEILGDGLQTKSYIYVTDVISAMKFVLDNSFDCPFDVFNVATQDYITVNQIAKIACQISGINLNEIKFTYTGGDRGWKGDVPKISFDTKKIRDLGWENKYSSFEAITHSISSMNLELLE